MQINAQRFLQLTEHSNSIAFFDIESTGFNGDYNSILCTSVKPYQSGPTTFAIQQPGNDRKVVRECRDYLESFDCWVTYYGRGFDIRMLNTRLLKWGLPPVQPRHHIDLYYSLKYKLLTSRKSQAHLLSWLKCPEQKMGVSASEWNDILYNTKEVMPTMIARCESDCSSLQGLYEATKHLVVDIKM